MKIVENNYISVFEGKTRINMASKYVLRLYKCIIIHLLYIFASTAFKRCILYLRVRRMVQGWI